MFLNTAPLLIALAGLVLYTVLAGADFGAGLWQLIAGRGEQARRIRDHAHNANAPVWEANHVWLILVLTVMWTAYPVVFGSVCSTLAIPLFLAAIGIVFRGLCYTLQSATEVARERRLIDTVFAISSILTPFMMGTVVGAVASGRVPVGNAAGNLFTSWLNPTSILSGVLAVAVGAFLAAVYLAADARRLAASALEDSFRRRALISGVLAGALAILGLVVVAHDAPRIYTGLTAGWGLAAVVVSAAAGVASLALTWARRFSPARAFAALAVAALLAGWAAAQRPDILPGLSLKAAAADRATMLAVVISIVAGGLILFPSLALLFRLSLAGRLDPGPVIAAPIDVTGPDARRPAWAWRAAVACLVTGVLLLTIANASIAHIFGVIAFAGAAWFAFTAVGPDLLAAQESPVHIPPTRVRNRR
jgi:cytochrome d ubiquinol oxidase subunit II